MKSKPFMWRNTQARAKDEAKFKAFHVMPTHKNAILIKLSLSRMCVG